MADLSEEGKAIVQEELKGYLATLRTLKSSRLGGPSGIVVPPYSVMQRAQSNNWTLSPSEQREPGPLSAVEGEVDDSGKLLEFLNSQNIQSK
ncbi:hypothetical protein Forpi1262_v015763 [Fusarium oxysporum f. sp. raphani]|uniref:Uncharacterized protein n=1 Tax=Fusarium oxysporum f. sp. raphani TaxID=96318 RepID=A0A8J5UGV1_FUSOX|nr:hypothetical protein Forpi1262_v015763 [Fusarium oxysporum f. sp. raphani]